MNRRDFAGTCLMAAGTAVQQSSGLGVWKALGRLQEEDGATPIEGGRWFSAQSPGDGMLFEFPAGTLAKSRALTADMLLDGKELAVFLIILREGEKGRGFRFSFGALNQCSFRMRLDLSLVDQGRWMSDREGAFLKPLCSGDRVDLALVDRISFTVSRTGPGGARWVMTPLQMLPALPPKLTTPVLPKGPLVDEFGQSALRDWPGKTRSLAELTSRVRRQFEDAPGVSWPGTFSKWGGLQALKLGEGTGWFRTQKHNGRWWLVDPAGCAFWSAGLDCVRVDTDARVDGIEGALKWIPGRDEFPGADRTSGGGRSQTRFINYLAANMVRALGPEGWRDKWAHIALAEMKRMRFNTVANWSDWEFAARAGFPYVRPLSFRGSRSPMVYRDFPDVFHSGFEQDATEYSAALASTAADPAFIGYFLMNEP
ncbi:MAG: hypothetical protein HZB13_07185, partial [Acidobacteria bacterium]|nr:hypothetical protein [Acidobacteriota bacterium]